MYYAPNPIFSTLPHFYRNPIWTNPFGLTTSYVKTHVTETNLAQCGVQFWFELYLFAELLSS